MGSARNKFVKTVESELFETLYKTDLITETNAEDS